jgi:hypothetical protein
VTATRQPSHDSGVLDALGLLLMFVGLLLIVAGLLYWAAGWRFGVFVAIWAAQWGLPLVGLGAGCFWFGRYAGIVVAVMAGGGGILLVVLGEVTGAYGSFMFTTVLDGAAILLGVAGAVRRRHRSLRR